MQDVSKKLVAVVVTAMLVVLNEWLGLDVDSGTVTQLVALVVAYVVGQGIADNGKEAAKVQAAAGVAHDLVKAAAETPRVRRPGPPVVALLLAPLLFMAGCAAPDCLPLDDVEGALSILADRHDAYVIGDPNLDAEQKEVYLRTSELMRAAIAEARAADAQ